MYHLISLCLPFSKVFSNFIYRKWSSNVRRFPVYRNHEYWTFQKEVFDSSAKDEDHLKWVIRVDVTSTKSLYDIVKTKAATGTKTLQRKMFTRSPDKLLKEIRTGPVQQIPRASLSLGTYSHEDKRVWQFFFKLLREVLCLVTFL